MEVLYSNILPLGTKKDQRTIKECFEVEIKRADRIDIAVGYISKPSLFELENLVKKYELKKIRLTIGMYYTEGIQESLYHIVCRINEEWHNKDIGEIRIVKPFKYHGKIYCFYHDENPISAIVGSANLSVIKPDANNLRQYELSLFITEKEICMQLVNFINELDQPKCSMDIMDVTNVPIISDYNFSLSDVEFVTQIPDRGVDLYEHHKTDIEFKLPLKVPPKDKIFSVERKYCTKSNLNVCYGAPRNSKKSRDWFETQITVNRSITESIGYPIKNVPFFVVTDDGYWFKAHTTSQGNKQFSAVGDELILGRWIKGRLVAAEIINSVNDTQKDADHIGMITKEMLEQYGCNELTLTKTDQKALDDDNSELDVWFLSFKPKKYK